MAFEKERHSNVEGDLSEWREGSIGRLSKQREQT